LAGPFHKRQRIGCVREIINAVLTKDCLQAASTDDADSTNEDNGAAAAPPRRAKAEVSASYQVDQVLSALAALRARSALEVRLASHRSAGPTSCTLCSAAQCLMTERIAFSF
jgi:hypothetical protein